MPPESHAPESRLRQRLIAAGPLLVVSILVALLWAMVILVSAVQKQRLVDVATRQLRVVNSAVVLQLRGLLRDIDSDLLMTEQWLTVPRGVDASSDKALAAFVRHIEEGSRGMVSVGFVSADGQPLALHGAPLWHAGMPRVPLQEAGNAALGVPLRADPKSPWRWPISRRLPAPAGAIAGVVAWIDLAKLSEQNEALIDSPGDAIGITTRSGIALMRTPWDEGLVGADVGKYGTLRHVPASQMTGVFDYQGLPVDKNASPRTVSFERMSDYPLTVLASRDSRNMFSLYYTRRNVISAVLCVITFFAFAFAVVLTRSQRAMRRSQAEFSALSAAFPLGIFRTDVSGKTTYANDAYAQQFGLSRDEIGWGWSTRVNESDRPRLVQQWSESAAAGRNVETALKIRLPDGRDAALSVRAAPLRVDGHLVGLVGSVEDVTAHARQQKAERMLNEIFEKSTDMVAQLDAAGRMVYLNPAGRRRLMLAPEAALDTLDYKDFTPVHRVLQVQGEIVPAAMANGIWVGETSVLDHRREEIEVNEMLIVHRDDDNQVEAISIVMRDIGADLRGRRQLQRNESIMRIVASTVPAALTVIDRRQRYVFVNGAFEQQLNKPRAAIIDRPMRDVLGDTVYERRRPHVEAALGGERTTAEIKREVDGRAMFMEITYTPFFDDDGRVIGVVGIGQDITAHRLQNLKLLDASQTDPLTGLLNRGGFDTRIGEALAQAHAEKAPLALLCIDLDGFKPVNDQFGHAAGDALLRDVARRLQAVTRPSDLLARLGGDEFAVVLRDVKKMDSACKVAQKIVAEMGAQFQIDAASVRIGASVGVALTGPAQESPDTLLRRADAALYRAKRGGRGRFEVAEETD